MKISHLYATDFYEKCKDESLESRLKYFYSSWNFIRDRNFFFAENSDGKIVGVLCLMIDYEDSSNYFLEFVTIDEEFKNQGISTKLIKKSLEFCAELKKNLKTGKFSPEGAKYIAPKLDTLCSNQKISWVNKDDYKFSIIDG